MKPFIPALLSIAIALMAVKFWPRHQYGSFLYQIFCALRVPFITILMICGGIFAIAAIANIFIMIWLGRSDGPTLAEVRYVDSIISESISTAESILPNPTLMAAISLILLIVASRLKLSTQAAKINRFISSLVGFAGIILASLSTLSLLPGSLEAPPDSIAIEVARTEGAVREIERQSQTLASSEAANELFEHIYSGLEDEDVAAITAALRSYEARVRNLDQLARQNWSSARRPLGELATRLADDWRPTSARDEQRLRRASTSTIRPLSSEVSRLIEQAPIRQIQRTAQSLQSTSMPALGGENRYIAQIRQSFINHSVRAIVDRLGANALRSAISGNPIAQQFLDAITDSTIQEASRRYEARRSALVAETLQTGTTPARSNPAQFSQPVARAQVTTGFVGRVNAAESSLDERVDCQCVRVPGGIIWSMTNVTIQQCYARSC